MPDLLSELRKAFYEQTPSDERYLNTPYVITHDNGMQFKVSVNRRHNLTVCVPRKKTVEEGFVIYYWQILREIKGALAHNGHHTGGENCKAMYKHNVNIAVQASIRLR